MVELGTQYGLDQISLYPARLNVSADKKVSTDGYLSIPQFGSDGRISKMERASFLTYNGNPATPYTEGRTYGVNILGTVGGEVAEDETITYHYRRSMIRDEAAGYLEQYRSSLRGEVIDLLESQEVGIFNLLFRASQLLNGTGELTGNTWTEDNISTAKTIISRMNSITRESEASLKWALLALAVADDVTYPADDEEAMAALGTLYREFITYPLEGGEKSIRSIAEANGEAAAASGETEVAARYANLVDAVDSILRAEEQLTNAIPAVCIRTSTERPEALDKACFILSGIDTKGLLQAVDTAVEMVKDEQNGGAIPVPDYTDINVSDKVVKIIQSYVGVVNKMVWRKEL